MKDLTSSLSYLPKFTIMWVIIGTQRHLQVLGPIYYHVLKHREESCNLTRAEQTASC